jgi:hypothetical protein
MYLPEPTEGGDFTPPPEGTHPATCYRFIDLGTQKSTFNNEEKSARKIMLSWEITDPEIMMDDDQPFIVSGWYTWSMHEKANLRKMLEGWRGKAFVESDFGQGGFNVKNLLGVGCLLNILHVTKPDGRVFANISNVIKMPKGMEAGDLRNEQTYLAVNAEEFDRDVFNGLSDKLQSTIRLSPEYQALERPAQQDGYTSPSFEETAASDDIPF